MSPSVVAIDASILETYSVGLKSPFEKSVVSPINFTINYLEHVISNNVGHAERVAVPRTA